MDMDDKPNTQIIVPYSSWYPVISSTGTPNENIGPGDDVTGSVFSKWAILFILSDSGENNFYGYFFLHKVQTVCLTRSWIYIIYV